MFGDRLIQKCYSCRSTRDVATVLVPRHEDVSHMHVSNPTRSFKSNHRTGTSRAAADRFFCRQTGSPQPTISEHFPLFPIPKHARPSPPTPPLHHTLPPPSSPSRSPSPAAPTPTVTPQPQHSFPPPLFVGSLPFAFPTLPIPDDTKSLGTGN